MRPSTGECERSPKQVSAHAGAKPIVQREIALTVDVAAFRLALRVFLARLVHRVYGGRLARR